MNKPRKTIGRSIIRCMKLEADFAQAFVTFANNYAVQHQLPQVSYLAAARHLMRLGLEFCSEEHSCEREGYFRGIAEAKAKLAGALKEG